MMLYAGGDSSAFETLYARHKGAVYRFFLRQLDAEAASECHQDVWLKIINFRKDYQPTSNFRSFLFTIAHNALTDYYRRNKRHQLNQSDTDPDHLPSDLFSDGTELPESLDRYKLTGKLKQLIHQLPFAQREALVLKEECGMTLKDIAIVTGSSEEGVKSRVRYAHEKLKKGLLLYGRIA